MDRNITSREELKSYFYKGAVPTAEQFGALIDSMVSFEDEPLLATDERIKLLLEQSGQPVENPGEERYSESGNDILTLPADGDWHSLPLFTGNSDSMSGCHVYVIYASLYNNNSCEYAMCSAVASHCNGGEQKISSPKKHWWGWSGKIKLRWKKSGSRLYLQMRTKCNKRGVEHIYYRISEEWKFIKSS